MGRLRQETTESGRTLRRHPGRPFPQTDARMQSAIIGRRGGCLRPGSVAVHGRVTLTANVGDG